MGSLEVRYLVSDIGGIFQRSLIDFQFNSTVVSEHILYDLNHLKILNLFYGPEYTLSDNLPCALGKKIYSAVLGETFYQSHYRQVD